MRELAEYFARKSTDQTRSAVVRAREVLRGRGAERKANGLGRVKRNGRQVYTGPGGGGGSGDGAELRRAANAGDACRVGAGGPRDLEAAVEYYEMAVSSENVAEAPGTRDRAVLDALEAIREAGPGSLLKEREAIWKERRSTVRAAGMSTN